MLAVCGRAPIAMCDGDAGDRATSSPLSLNLIHFDTHTKRNIHSVTAQGWLREARAINAGPVRTVGSRATRWRALVVGRRPRRAPSLPLLSGRKCSTGVTRESPRVPVRSASDHTLRMALAPRAASRASGKSQMLPQRSMSCCRDCGRCVLICAQSGWTW